MACRSYLRKLEQHDLVQLPKPLCVSTSPVTEQFIQPVFHDKTPIENKLKELSPIKVAIIEKGYDLKLFKYMISAYHYLGWSRTVGENIKYLFYDKDDRLLGCMMFGAAAWKVAPRDKYIGWSKDVREKNLNCVINNNRFLILPWVKVKYLASHILGIMSRRVNDDWQSKYNHPVYLMETFVDETKYKGTCYKSANWKYMGQTQGRGKLDKQHKKSLSIKGIYLYPLAKKYKTFLNKVYE